MEYGITEENFDLMAKSCENYDAGDPEADAAYAKCVEEYNSGNALRLTMRGHIIVRNEYDNSLYFIENGTNNDLNPLIDFKNESKFRKEILKDNSFHVKKSLIRQIPNI